MRSHETRDLLHTIILVLSLELNACNLGSIQHFLKLNGYFPHIPPFVAFFYGSVFFTAVAKNRSPENENLIELNSLNCQLTTFV